MPFIEFAGGTMFAVADIYRPLHLPASPGVGQCQPYINPSYSPPNAFVTDEVR
jgi:hypothetical protein